jgi:hypothetical protein
VTSNVVVLYHSDASASQLGTGLGTRERKRLDRAREKGYLDARCRNNQKLREAFGLWCWRLKVPMVWFERQTPRSKYGHVHLELFTTANRLTAGAQEAMQAICDSFTPKRRAAISPHTASCDRVPLSGLEDLAKALFRTATRTGNYELEIRAARLAASA